jgi:hypothetical protein
MAPVERGSVPATVAPSLPMVVERYIITKNFESFKPGMPKSNLLFRLSADHGPKIKVHRFGQIDFS